MKGLLIALALLSLPVAAPAGHPTEFVQISAGDPVTLRPDRAYILYRTLKLKDVKASDTVFMREPDSLAGTGPAPNLTRVRASQPFAETATENIYLIEAKPARYLIAGQADKMSPATETCFCMGTVRFVAKPGMVTDLGYILTDHVSSLSPIPELRNLTGRGDRINGTGRILAGAVRLVTPDSAIPAQLREWPRAPAEYRAVGKFTNYFAFGINRLAPLPGVLEYDEDRVIDVKAEGRTP